MWPSCGQVGPKRHRVQMPHPPRLSLPRTAGEKVPLDVLVRAPATPTQHYGVVPHDSVVPRGLHDGSPAPDRADLIQQPDARASVGLVDRPGHVAPQDESTPEVPCLELVAGQVNDLARVHVLACTKSCGEVQERHRLAHTSGTSQNYQRVRDGLLRDVRQDFCPVAHIESRPILEQPMRGGPGQRIGSRSRSAPPRVGVDQRPP